MFDPSTASVNGKPLRCAGGADTGDTCLSDAQITALKTIDTRYPLQLPAGQRRRPSIPATTSGAADLGIAASASPMQPTVTFLALGTSQPAMPMPRTAPYISVFSTSGSSIR